MGHVMLFVDFNKLAQVLRNLFSNAIKFTPRGGCVEVTVVLVDSVAILAHQRLPQQVQPITSVLCITVTDTGAGISAVRMSTSINENAIHDI